MYTTVELTCSEKERNDLCSLNMRDGVEERSLSDAVDIVDVRPELETDLDNVQPAGAGDGTGTTCLVED